MFLYAWLAFCNSDVADMPCIDGVVVALCRKYRFERYSVAILYPLVLIAVFLFRL